MGMTLLREKDGLKAAVAKAFAEDDEVLVETLINGTEVTCGVLRGSDGIIVLPLTEIVSKKEFFDYEAKYVKGKADEITPARISEEQEKHVKRISANLYHQLNCNGVVRFDYILSEGAYYFLEVNTVPGMSEASIVPQQAEFYGLTLTSMISMLLEEAFALGAR